MQLPNESASSWAHLGFGSFTYSSLRAWGEADLLSPAHRVKVSELADSLKPPMDALLKEARETQDVMIFVRPAAQARQNVALVLLKRTTKETLQWVVSKLGGGSEDSPVVRTFLPKLLATIDKQRMAKRPDAVGLAVGRLRALTPVEGKEELAARLEGAAQNAATMIGAAETAYGAWQTERSEEVMAKGRFRLALESAHRGLGAEFPGQHSFVESFFLRAGKPSEGGNDDAGGGDDDGGDAT